MGLESVTHISDLVITNPVGATDPKSQGDNHIRNIKVALKTDFPNITGAVTATQGELNELAGAAAGAGMVQDIAVLTDANADRILFWDDSAGAVKQLAADGTTVAIAGTTLSTGSNVPLLNASNAFTNNMSISGNLTMTGNIGLADDGSVAAPGGTPSITFDSSGGVLALVAATSITLNAVNTTDYVRKSQSNTLTGAFPQLTLSAAVPEIRLNCTGDAADNRMWRILGNGEQFRIIASDDLTSTGTVLLTVDRTGVTVDQIAWIATTHSFTGVVSTPNTSAEEVGTAGVGQRIKSADYTGVITDANKNLHQTGASKTFTIPANASVAYPIGTCLNFTCANATGVTIAITSDTLRLAGIGTTGSRTLAQYGDVTAHKIAATEWYIGGSGLT